MNNYCVYKHTSPSGKVYIGITCQPPIKRWGKRGQNYSGSKYFWKAIQKYGWENIKHEILQENLTQREARALEVSLIAEHRSNEEDFGYNITIGGGGAAGYKQSPEHIRQRTEKTTEKKRGKSLSEEQKLKISLNNARFWLGKPRSEETRRKISDSLLGKKISPETLKKRSETFRKNHPPKEKLPKKYPKPVVQYDALTGEFIAVYESARIAQEKTGTRYQDISSCIHGRQKTAHGYKWKLYEEVDPGCTTSNLLKLG